MLITERHPPTVNAVRFHDVPPNTRQAMLSAVPEPDTALDHVTDALSLHVALDVVLDVSHVVPYHVLRWTTSNIQSAVLVSLSPVLSTTGLLGRSWRPMWEPQSPRMALSGLLVYRWDSLYHVMRHHSPVGVP